MKAILALENGSLYQGISCGIAGEKTGEVSFYTGVVGYQELITSPVNAGKIVVMTYPLIGNYGVARKFQESRQCWASGIVIKEKTRLTSNWQAEQDFVSFLKKEKVLALEQVDTRTLMVELRNKGEQWGIISTRDFNPRSLRAKIKKAKQKKQDFLNRVSVKRIKKSSGRGRHIAVVDLGVTNGLLRQLEMLGCRVSLIPYQANADDILALAAKGVIVSDGPEMEKGLGIAAGRVKELLGKVPVLGIGTGCQVLAMAMGGRLKKMYLGHRGVNYPVVKPGCLKGEITVQNHRFIIDQASLKGRNIKITWQNLNDKTIEGIENRKLKAFGCQFLLVSPGSGEVNPILKEFVNA
ncbi:carbamoyl phosphate synthase small subunit [Candidatus Omnitrophota bacterium]